MTQIKCIGIEEAAGKTVKAIAHSDSSDCLLIVFTDGSIIHLYSCGGYDEDAQSIEEKPLFDAGNFSWQVLQDAIGDLCPDIVATRKTETETRNAKAVKANETEERAQT